MFQHCFVALSFWLIAANQAAPLQSRPKLKGVIIRAEPIVYLNGSTGSFTGYGPELLEQIAKRADFEYELALSPDLRYGSIVNGKINGMIGEVAEKRADFALADLTITEERQALVDFTEPILENQLSALIHKKDAAGLNSLEDLVRRNQQQQSASSSSPTVVALGVLKDGSIYGKLNATADKVGRAIFSSFTADTLVPSFWMGVDRAGEGGFAMIVESTTADYLTGNGRHCNLTSLPDRRGLFPRQHAIVLAKGSPLLEQFNKAIRQLKADGTMDRLKEKYWRANRC